MKFTELTEVEYQEFFNSSERASFMQSIELGELKKEFGSTVYLVGIKEKDRIVAATLLLANKTYFGKVKFYAPRGLLVDYHNYDILNFFTTELKVFIKNHNGFILTIDPNVIYRTRNSDGEIIDNDEGKDELSISNLISLGYKHYGFNIYLDTMQARWAYRMKLDDDYEIKKSKFSKSTRKNIDSTFRKGLMVRKGSIDDLDVMTEIFDITSKRRDFFSRSLSYYQKMYKHMKDLMTIYIAYLEPDVYYNHTLDLLNQELDNQKVISMKMEHDNVGNRLLAQKETSDKLIDKYNAELKKAEKFKKTNPNGKAVGCLLSIRSGNEYLTLSSGVLEEYKSFTPKYAMYEKHIIDAYNEKMEYCNFYGITGDFNKDGKYYGIYEFKKGFSGNVIEYIGEFELKVGAFYSIYNFLKKIKNCFRK